jgi:hypothetical protein
MMLRCSIKRLCRGNVMAAKSKKLSLPAELASFASPPALAPKPPFAPMSLESLADFGRENLAAVTKANLALSEGIQAMSQEIFGFAQVSFASAAKTASALLAARTLDEVVELSSAHARLSFASLAQRSAKLSEMGVSIASETLAPFVARGVSA